MAKHEPDPQSRARGLFAGIELGVSFKGSPTPADHRGRESSSGELRLIEALARELLAPQLDFPRLVTSWAAAQPVPETWLSEETPLAIQALRTSGAPAPDDSFGPGLGAALVTLPVALRTHRTPANLIGGTYHISRLLDPHPLGNWAAVAVNVAVACFMAGRRDFVPDVLEALKANDAPGAMMETIERVPIWRRPTPAAPDGRAGGMLPELETVLWALHHESQPDRVTSHLSPGLARSIGLALIGARDGETAVLALAPERVPSVELDRLAEQLAG
ncbi:MAG: ADP-ribosylglycohydrolase family protein [Gemmatimonadota bacterium]